MNKPFGSYIAPENTYTLRCDVCPSTFKQSSSNAVGLIIHRKKLEVFMKKELLIYKREGLQDL